MELEKELVERILQLFNIGMDEKIFLSLKIKKKFTIILDMKTELEKHFKLHKLHKKAEVLLIWDECCE